MNTWTAVIVAKEKENCPKASQEVCGKAMIHWVSDAARCAGASSVVAVFDDEKNAMDGIRQSDVASVTRKEALPELIIGAYAVILRHDTPLLCASTIEKAVKTAFSKKLEALLVTATDKKESIEESGTDMGAVMYVVSTETLQKHPELLKTEDWTDCLTVLGKAIDSDAMADAEEGMAAADGVALARAEALLRQRINRAHMYNGVRMTDPERTYIDDGVTIGKGSVLLPGTILKGSTVIGEGCTIGPETVLTDCRIGNGTTVMKTVGAKAVVGEGTQVGPFTYLRPDTFVGDSCRVGDFVELKNSTIGNGTKVSHLTYVGDSDVGERVNFGCGTVTVNYDGAKKYRTTIGNDVFVGCNSNLVAPVTLADGAYTAAGSTITDDVPERTLAIARARQVLKENWKDRRKKQ